MMRALVTGACGMLGTDICTALANAGHEPLPTDIVNAPTILDITDGGSVKDVFRKHKPDVVIHCAAYTNVDKAETDSDTAYRVNALGSWRIANECANTDVPLCAISTDFVFDGEKSEPYIEFDMPKPLSVYGASKLAGETCIRQIWRRHWIVRTAWLFGVHGKSFPNSILTAAETRPELRVVADQKGTPTFTEDLAAAILQIIDGQLLYGTYHVANAGTTTWFDFAVKALELNGNTGTNVIPISSEEWPTPVKRPSNSALRPLALEMQGIKLPRPWEEALALFIQKRKLKATK